MALDSGSHLAVLFGGASTEREVSLASGQMVAGELERLEYSVQRVCLDQEPLQVLAKLEADAAIIMMHGDWGEDGRLQGYLDLLKLPYSGSRPLACALAMNKALAKAVFKNADVPTPAWHTVTTVQEFDYALECLQLPCVIKPISEGSSVGVMLCETAPSRDTVLLHLKKYQSLLVEKYISGNIITVPIIDVVGCERVLAPLEILPKDSVLYDQRAKETGQREYVLRPQFDAPALKSIGDAAWKAHKALTCSGVTRVDLIYSIDGPQVLEVNTIPGMGPRGNLISACEAQGITKNQLVQYIVQSVR